MPQNIVSIQAHPDDTEVFCAGTLALLSAAGHSVHVVTLTGGGMGGTGEGEAATIATRVDEARKAAELIGASYTCLSGRDGFLFDSADIRQQVLEAIRTAQADIVLTHLPFDYHADHRATANVAEIACMLTTLPNAPCAQKPLSSTPLLYHEAPLRMCDNLGRKPPPADFIVDVTSVMGTKEEMLGCHKTQQDLMRIMHGMDDFFGEMRQFAAAIGADAGVSFGEAFWQHRGGGFAVDPGLQNLLPQKLVHRNGGKQ